MIMTVVLVLIVIAIAMVAFYLRLMAGFKAIDDARRIYREEDPSDSIW